MKQKEVLEKLKILSFWERHGLAATLEAFGVKRRTLFLWKKHYKESGGLAVSLKAFCRKPKNLRKRNYPDILVNEIRRLRSLHNNIGKEKLHVLLKSFCETKGIKLPSAKTIGRIIADAPDKMRIAPQKVRHCGKVLTLQRKKRNYKPKGFKALYPGHCVAFDSIERFVDGCKRYIVTGIDIYSRFAFALQVANHSAKETEYFFKLFTLVFPFPIHNILTDCGSEFQKDFASHLQNAHQNHWNSYPKTPKMNAHDERFNRTVQEEFVDYHLDSLINDSLNFNDKLLNYLLWYNSTRPHWGLNLLSPIQFLNNNHQCNMYWPNTFILKIML
jgi:transposase InsO family protein